LAAGIDSAVARVNENDLVAVACGRRFLDARVRVQRNPDPCGSDIYLEGLWRWSRSGAGSGGRGGDGLSGVSARGFARPTRHGHRARGEQLHSQSEAECPPEVSHQASDEEGTGALDSM
jgi:hypothetical protein